MLESGALAGRYENMDDPVPSLTDGQERRERVMQRVRAETGIDDAMIERLVRGFYDRVRADELLGPVFAARITDWEPHLRRMFAFWSSVALHSGVYHGDPMGKHVVLPVDARHFDRWLALFASTAAALCPPPAAALFIERAQRIARSLEMGIASSRGILLPPGQRYLTEPSAA